MAVSVESSAAHSRIGLPSMLALAGMVGALGWGIRGQFGGETGAMVPGAMYGLCVAIILRRLGMSVSPVVMGAVGALGFSVGGSMTYGQTLGLMHNEPQADTYWWGFLGLALKGGVWIALGGLFLGMASGQTRYPPAYLLLIIGGAVVMFLAGATLINSPHNPPLALPHVYFSDPVHEPRREIWAGLWFAYVWLLGWAWNFRDKLALRLSAFGLVGGALGFPLGEVAQAWGIHAAPLGQAAQRWIDWWKVMECSFGAFAGLSLALAAGTFLPQKRGQEPFQDEKVPDPFSVAPRATASSTVLPAVTALTVVWCVLLLLGDVGVMELDWLLGIPFLGVSVPLLCCLWEGTADTRSPTMVSLTVLWSALFLLADLSLLPAEWLLRLAVLGMAVPVACCLWEAVRSGRSPTATRPPASFVVLVPLLLALSGANLVAKILDSGPPAELQVAALLGLLIIAGTCWAAGEVRWRAEAGAWLLGFVVVSQTALTWGKAMMGGDTWGDSWRAFLAGAGLTVEVIFAALAVGILATLWTLVRHTRNPSKP